MELSVLDYFNRYMCRIVILRVVQLFTQQLVFEEISTSIGDDFDRNRF